MHLKGLKRWWNAFFLFLNPGKIWQNMHRHQKKQKEQKFAIYRPPALSRCSDFVFFGLFDACAGFVHLVVWFCWFFWCLCRFCGSNLHQTCTGIKKNKKDKSLQSIDPQPWVDAQTLFFLVCLMPVQVLCIYAQASKKTKKTKVCNL